MDQQDRDVRRLCAHGFAVPEFGHGGDRTAVAGRAEAARAVPRAGAGRGVRRAVRAAGIGWIGPGPGAAAQGAAIAAGRKTPDQGRQAAIAERRDLYDRIPARRAVVPAASRHLHQESRPARHRGQHPVDRRRAVSRAGGILRFRHDDDAPEHVADAGRQPAAVLYVARGRHQGIVQSGGSGQSCDRRAGRQGDRRRNAR